MAPSVASPLLWIGFTGFILGMLALDLGLHRQPLEQDRTQALNWTIVWISLAVLFCAGVHLHFGRQRGLEFLTGYVMEYALSVDNLLVFLLTFRYFAVPIRFQRRVLFWGVLGALVTRFLFVFVGTTLLNRFHWVIFVFGAVVILCGLQMLIEKEVEVHPERNLAVRIFRMFVRTSSQDAGDRFLVRLQGRTYATPLLLVLVVIEAADIAFAADSIPAVFAVTRDPFIAYTSNIFAIVGLRSLYLLVAQAMNRLRYLKWGLGLVLLFAGIKMMIGDYFPIPIGISLVIVGTLLGVSMLISLLRPDRPPRSAVSGQSSPVPTWPRGEAGGKPPRESGD